MNRDLVYQLDAYFSEVDERQGPVTVDEVTDVLGRVHELPPPAPVRVRQRPKVWVAAAAAAAVLIAIGIVPLVVGSQDTETSPAEGRTVVREPRASRDHTDDPTRHHTHYGSTGRDG